MEYDNDHSSGREELLRSSAVPLTCTQLDLKRRRAREDPIRITNARSYLRDPREQALSLYSGKTLRRRLPSRQDTHAGSVAYRARVLTTNRAPERSKQRQTQSTERRQTDHSSPCTEPDSCHAHPPGCSMIASIEQAGTGVALPAIRDLDALVGSPRGLKQHSRAGPE